MPLADAVLEFLVKKREVRPQLYLFGIRHNVVYISSTYRRFAALRPARKPVRYAFLGHSKNSFAKPRPFLKIYPRSLLVVAMVEAIRWLEKLSRLR